MQPSLDPNDPTKFLAYVEQQLAVIQQKAAQAS
jgi:hypothetical protein